MPCRGLFSLEVTFCRVAVHRNFKFLLILIDHFLKCVAEKLLAN